MNDSIYYQYLFVINPDSIVSDQIITFKKELSQAIGEFSSLHSDPHITIGSIILTQLKEDMLLERMQYVCAHAKPFNIALDGFGSFKPHTVYARLADSQKVREFTSTCERSCDGLPSKKGWQPKAKNPHMTIGRELGSKFKQSKELFVNRLFQARFEVTELRVMRRELEGRYSIIKELPFQG